jgi:hypothetical protein
MECPAEIDQTGRFVTHDVNRTIIKGPGKIGVLPTSFIKNSCQYRKSLYFIYFIEINSTA